MYSGLRITFSLLAAASFVFAQDTNSPSGWKPIGGSASGQAPALQQNGLQQYGPGPYGQNQAGPPPQAAQVPPQLNLKAGTLVSVRVNQTLSSDKNQAGETFSATVVRPLIVDGFVVAQTNQTFGGKVAEAAKAGKPLNISHLGLQLTDLMFVDGQNAAVQSELVAIDRPGHQDANGYTVSAAGGAPGAAPAPSVLQAHGKSVVINPEYVLTFKINSDVTIATDRAPQAFRPVSAADYRTSLQAGRYGAPGYYAGAYPYGYGYPYGYPYYGYPYWGPGFGVGFGGFWGPGVVIRGRFR